MKYSTAYMVLGDSIHKSQKQSQSWDFGISNPVQQPGLYWDRPSAIVILGLNPHRGGHW